MKKLLSKVMTPLAKAWAKVTAFYDSKISKHVEKVKYALSHNFIIRRVGLKLILFGFIKIDIYLISNVLFTIFKLY
jgi:hypothetical protein